MRTKKARKGSTAVSLYVTVINLNHAEGKRQMSDRSCLVPRPHHSARLMRFMAPRNKARLFNTEMIDIPTLSYTSIREFPTL